MHRNLGGGPLCALALAALFAAAALAASIPDTVTTARSVMSRRGSLGANSYVVTEVLPDPPGYRLSTVEEMKLRDRAVNYIALTATNATLSLPARRSAAGFAISLLVCADVTADAGCVVSFSGADELCTPGWNAAKPVAKGRSLFSFIELRDGVFMVEHRELEDIPTDKEEP